MSWGLAQGTSMGVSRALRGPAAGLPHCRSAAAQFVHHASEAIGMLCRRSLGAIATLAG